MIRLESLTCPRCDVIWDVAVPNSSEVAKASDVVITPTRAHSAHGKVQKSPPPLLTAGASRGVVLPSIEVRNATISSMAA